MDNNEVNAALAQFLEIPEKDYCGEIHTALEAAEVLQGKGFSFQLQDMCPKDMDKNLWRARFISPDEKEISEESEEPGRAVCLAAVHVCQDQQP